MRGVLLPLWLMGIVWGGGAAGAEAALPGAAELLHGSVIPVPDTLRSECAPGFLSPNSLDSWRLRTERFRAGPRGVGFPTRHRLPAGACPEAEAGSPGASLEVLGGMLGDRGRLGLVSSDAEAFSEPLPGRAGPSLRVLGEAVLGPRIRIAADVAANGTDLRGDALYARWEAGPVYGWLGRAAPAYGVGRGGGLILSGAVPLDGLGLGLARGAALPWAFGRLGTVDGELLLARAKDNGEIGSPWLLAGRGTLSPREDLTFGVTRGIMFAGEGAADVTVWRLVRILAGAHVRGSDGEVVPFSNQIASFDVAWSPHRGKIPFLLFLEWGMEDNSGAWIRSPGVVAGLEAAHPERGLRMGLERTYISGINGHGIWYRHSVYRAGWSDGGRLLGHPLGGPGTEWLLHGAIQDDGGAWDLEVGLRTRERLRQNSFSPTLEGRAWGGFVNGRYRTGPVDLFLQVDGERVRGGARRLSAEGGVRWELR